MLLKKTDLPVSAQTRNLTLSNISSTMSTSSSPYGDFTSTSIHSGTYQVGDFPVRDIYTNGHEWTYDHNILPQDKDQYDYNKILNEFYKQLIASEKSEQNSSGDISDTARKRMNKKSSDVGPGLAEIIDGL